MRASLEFDKRVLDLFDQVLDLSEEERSVFLEGGCSADREVVAEVLRHLDAERQQLPDAIGPFLVIDRLGRGAHGTVYKAIHPQYGKIAIKVVGRECADSSEAQSMERQLVQEALKMSRVYHPHIVKIFDVGRQGNQPFIVMECVDGRSLKNLLRESTDLQRKLNWILVINILRQLAIALDHAHKQGVVHRDVTPGNVLVTAEGALGNATAKLTDFGVAKVISSGYSFSLLPAGTPGYMSPQQIRMEPVDGRSDQFSLAAIAYEMLAGRRPFNASDEGLAALADMMQKERPPSVQVGNAALSPIVDTVLRRGLNKNPEDRFSTCLQFVMALEQALMGKPARGFAKAIQVSEELTNKVVRYTLRGRYRYSILVAMGTILFLAVIFFVGSLPVVDKAKSLLHLSQTAPGNLALRPAEPIQWENVSLNVTGDDIDIGKYGWRDIEWRDAYGWLAGSISEGGGDGTYLGRGILLFSNNNGASWRQVPRRNFHSGSGTLSCFNETWDDISSITAIQVLPRPQPGNKVVNEGWLTSWSGVYFTDNVTDLNMQWRRITPPPDGPGCYSQFGDMAQVQAFRELYTVGWQGIAHWLRGRGWEVQKSTHTYAIASIYITGDANRSAWAVGSTGNDGPGLTGSDSHGALYHLEWPGRQWSRVPLPINLDYRQQLNAVTQSDYKTVVVVGDGIIIRGSRDVGGPWSWQEVPSPTKKRLTWVLFDEQRDRFWAGGAEGTILTSDDHGLHWILREMKDQNGRTIKPNLTRARIKYDWVWALGQGVILRTRRF